MNGSKERRTLRRAGANSPPGEAGLSCAAIAGTGG
jgi:hypothetical protein